MHRPLKALTMFVIALAASPAVCASCKSVEDLSNTLQPLSERLFSATFSMLRVAEPLQEDSAEVGWAIRTVFAADGAQATIEQVLVLASLSREMKHLADRSAIAVHVERLIPLKLKELTLREKDLDRSVSKLSHPDILKPAQDVRENFSSVLKALHSHCATQ